MNPLYQNETNRFSTRLRGTLLGLGLLFSLPAGAINVLPGVEVSLTGTTATARPELGGVVLADVNRPFAIPDGFGGNVKGYLQDSVVRSSLTGTLMFSQRIVLYTTSSTHRSLSDWSQNSFTSVTTDADYATDGLGSVGAGTALRSGTGSSVRFKLPRLLAPGETTYFHILLTNATGYAATGKTVLSGPGISKTLTTYQPSGTVQPYYVASSIGYGSYYSVKINNKGQAVATVGDGSTSLKTVLWQPTVTNGTDGVAYLIPPIAGYPYNEAKGINNLGQVVGTSYHRADRLGDATERAFLWTPSVPNGVTGTTINLGTYPGGSYSGAWGINDAGQVVGGGDYPGSPLGADGLPYGTSLLWSGGGVHFLAGTGFGAGYAINSSGMVAGYGNFAAGTYQGFRWTPAVTNGTTGTTVSVNTVGGTNYQGPGTANDINDSGVAVGTAQFNYPAGPIETHGYIWSGSTVTDLGNYEMPYAINNNGVAVGATNYTTGALYRNRVRSYLRYFVSPANWLVSWASDINSKEQIAGFGWSPTFGYAQLVMTPVKIATLTPTSIRRGSGSFTITVNGTGFLSGATVLWNGGSLTTARINSNRLTATVPAYLLNLPGTVSVMVLNPDGTTSSVRAFTIL